MYILLKPKTSRYANSEKYIVCNNFKYNFYCKKIILYNIKIFNNIDLNEI